MKYEINILKDNKEIDNYIATEYKTVVPTGRVGHKITERHITEIKIKPENAKRYKIYDILHNTIIVKELETGRRILTMEQKQY